MRLHLLLFLFSFSLPCTHSNSIDHLLKWAAKQGANVFNIHIGSSSVITDPHRRSTFFSSGSHSPGTVLTTIPLALSISEQTALNNSLFQTHVARFLRNNITRSNMHPGVRRVDATHKNTNLLQLSSCTAVALFLTLEHLPIPQLPSKWIKYYQTLPSFNHQFNLPQLQHIIQSKQEQNQDQDQDWFQILMETPSMRQRILSSRNEIDQIIQILSDTVFLSLEQAYPNLSQASITTTFIWAFSIVQTRTWTNVDQAFNRNCILFPIIDLFNHNDNGFPFAGIIPFDFVQNNMSTQHTSYISENNITSTTRSNTTTIQNVGIIATENVIRNQEIFISYSGHVDNPKNKKCAQDFLFDFGFVSNPTQLPWCFQLDVKIQPIGNLEIPELIQFQHMLFDQLNATINSTIKIKFKEKDVALPKLLLILLRIIFSDDSDIIEAQKLGNANVPLTLNNERKVLQLLDALMRQHLNELPSSNELDEMLVLKTENENMKTAYRLRIHERRLFQKAIQNIQNECDKVMLNEKLWE